MTASVEVSFPLGRRLKVLPHRAASHDFTAMERQRIEAMILLLRPGMVVYDVGAEQGDFGALAASIVGSGCVHLFEPTPVQWRSLRDTFGANDLGPGGTFPGFVSDTTRGDWKAQVRLGGWPSEADLPLREESAFSVVSERPDLPATTLDAYALHTMTHPGLVTIDVEGAEVLVLEGMRGILRTLRPLVLVSIHPADPGFLGKFPAPRRIAFDHRPERSWKLPLMCEQEQVFRIFSEARYAGHWLATDHEIHWLFAPLEKAAETFAQLPPGPL